MLVIEKFVDPYNAKDIDALLSLYHPEAEVSFFVFPTRRGLDEIRELWLWDFAAFPDGKVTLLARLSDAATEMVEWSWTGTNKGDVTMPSGETVPATGGQATVKGMDIVEVQHDLIHRHRLYFQEVALMSQMGLMPSPQATV